MCRWHRHLTARRDLATPGRVICNRGWPGLTTIRHKTSGMCCLQVQRIIGTRQVRLAPGGSSSASCGPQERYAQELQETFDCSPQFHVTFQRRLTMRRYGVAVLAIVSLFARVRSPAADGIANEETVAKELQAFKGTWRLSSKEEDG